ncbi:MAG: glycosyltransferase, partial [Candidatus Helarchaeota archaeon]|nr:glycosyltransferase [Candidatus Helarchaeota archaeon]
SIARGDYIARMDSDDVSLPERLDKQVAFMDQHPEVGICGTWSETIGEVKKSWKTCFPTGHGEIVSHLLFNTAISHPTAMFDMIRFRALKLRYDVNAIDAEDYDLWVTASDHFSLGNVPEVLFFYRVHPQQISQIASTRQKQTTTAVRKKMLANMGIEASDDEIALHSQLSNYTWVRSHDFYTASKRWLQKIERMAPPSYRKAVRRECLKRLIELHHFVFRGRRVIEKTYLSLREILYGNNT